MILEEYLNLPSDDKFEYFMHTLIKTNRTPSYWVNWDNVRKNMREHELHLNTLNYLLGKQNIREEAKKLFLEQPELLTSVPILLASRCEKIGIFYFENESMKFKELDFIKPDLNRIDDYILFLDKAGLLDILKNNEIGSSLVDYVFGVQVGLDSNGRKNRGGTQNENILEFNLKKLVKNTKFEYMTQATAARIFQEWNIKVPESLESNKNGGRRYDGAVYNPSTRAVTVIETNFYNSGGSKLKAVAGEFSDIYNTSLKNANNVNFVWISDGEGWNTAKNPMSEAFQVIPNIFNLNMVNDGFLRDVVKG